MFTEKPDALPKKQRALRGRRLVAVDIENVIGGAVLDIDQAISAWAELGPELALIGGEQIIVGVSHIGAINSWRAKPDARLVVRSGTDGADLALLDVLENEHVAERFDEVFVVSGDGIFTDAVARLGELGIKVTVIARSGHISRTLRMAAARVILLPEIFSDIEGAA